MAPLPSWELGTGDRQCHQGTSLQVTPPHTHTPQLCVETPLPGKSSIILSCLHHTITPAPSALVYTVCTVMIICAGFCVSLQVFLCPLCVYERGLWLVCVCVCPHMRSRALCACVSAPDQPLIAIFSPVDVGGSHLAPWWEKGRIWILRVRGRGGKGRQSKMMTVEAAFCTAPQPPLGECRRSILDNCFVYRITNNWLDYFFPSKLTEPTGCFGAKWSLPFVVDMWPSIHLCLVFAKLEFSPLENGCAILGGLEELNNACNVISTVPGTERVFTPLGCY